MYHKKYKRRRCEVNKLHSVTSTRAGVSSPHSHWGGSFSSGNVAPEFFESRHWHKENENEGRKNNVQLRSESHKDRGWWVETGRWTPFLRGGIPSRATLASSGLVTSTLCSLQSPYLHSWELPPYLLEPEATPRVRIFPLEGPSIWSRFPAYPWWLALSVKGIFISQCFLRLFVLWCLTTAPWDKWKEAHYFRNSFKQKWDRDSGRGRWQFGRSTTQSADCSSLTLRISSMYCPSWPTTGFQPAITWDSLLPFPLKVSAQ